MSPTRSRTPLPSLHARFWLQLPIVKRRLALLYGLNGAVLPYLKPGSWVGGDRDGNPFVTAQTLKSALHRQAETVLDHYLEQVNILGTELSLSEEFVSVSASLKSLAASPEHTSRHQIDEPYRRALVTCYSRLAATRKIATGAWTGSHAALGCRALSLARGVRRRFDGDRRNPCATTATPIWRMAGCSICGRRSALSGFISRSWMCDRTRRCMNRC